MVKKEHIQKILYLNWLTIAILIMVFTIPAFSNQESDPNAPELKKIAGYRAIKNESGEGFLYIPVYEDGSEGEPSEAASVIPSAAKPSLIQDELTSSIRRSKFEIGPEIYWFHYEEPDLMEEEGLFYGIYLSYTHRNWIATPQQKATSDVKEMFRFEGRLAFGQVDYDGGTWDGTPLKYSNINDSAFESRFLYGRDLILKQGLATIYTGMGYRYLYDKASVIPGGYKRESNYLYLPVGCRLDDIKINDNWNIGIGAEFDYLLLGTQETFLSDFHPALGDVNNKQSKGWGYRASLEIMQKNKNGVLIIKPFVRFWNIDESETEPAGYGIVGLEPDNETTEAGIQFILMF